MEGSDHEALIALEQKISEDKSAKYMGTAEIFIKHLEFPHPCRKIDWKIVDQLVRDFDGEGCIRDQPVNRIPAVISNSILQEGLQKLAISAEAFRATSKDKPVKLPLSEDVKLECLHGQHRILAAEEFYNNIFDRWWIVDLYGSDLENYTKQALREGYSYSARYASGEIFRYIRISHYNHDSLGEERWRARLSPHQEPYYSRLLERGKLLGALDSVLHIQGLWRTFYVGSLNEILTLGLDEEVSRYIKDSILIIWERIFDNNTQIMMNSDPSTIQSIQSRAPALSKSDFDFIQDNMRSKEFFPEVKDPELRAKIKQRLLDTRELIPSFATLISNIRYLKQPAKILNVLLPPKAKKRTKRAKRAKGMATTGTLRQRFYFHYTRRGSCDQPIEIQQSAQSYTLIPRNGLDAFELSYQMLWLCACRVWKYPNPYGIYQLARLAKRLGFSSKQIDEELTKTPIQAIIEKAVQEVLYILRPNEEFGFDANQARPLITSFNDYLANVLVNQSVMTSPYITVAGSGEPLSRRSGYGCMDGKDLNHLFLDKIHCSLQEYHSGGEEISSFYVKRSRHIAFFGAIDLTGNREAEFSPSVNVPLERSVTTLTIPEREAVDSSSTPNEQTPNLEGSSRPTQNQLVQYTGPVVTFMKGDVPIKSVPFIKDDVNNQAREYAHQGMKLQIPDSGFFIWKDCFAILTRTKSSTVLLSLVVEPIIGKRRHDQKLPDKFKLVTKEAFDFTMDDEEL